MGRGLVRLALSILLAASAPAPAAAQEQLPVHVGGRVVAEGPVTRFGWPGVYFEGRFSGTEVTVAVDSATEHFRLLVDGRERALLTKPGTARLTVAGLAPGAHTVRLDKLTESQEGGGRFLGFWAARPLPARPRARRIEFIGDSYSAGYGNAAHGRACTRQEVHDLTDTTRAFGPLVAARLDADYRVIAYSGFGIVRNYAGGVPDLSLPAIYDRAIPGEPAEAAADGWRPQLIVIALGTNDFSTPLRAGERWADQAALRADYRARYLAFVRRLQARQPQARFILLGHESFFAEVARVAAALNRGSGRPVAALRHGDLERTGCDWHPSLADHRALADLLNAAIARLDGIWD
ncbi:MAG TPA: SGNH/GDSL hydrolase family protein [Allosphingosinicella sp.]|nr:SGNH/GDSL hydrolase family protein [Allosphingosinicella sp.]